jgi:hypothetical protein
MVSSRKKQSELETIDRLRWIYKSLPEGRWLQPDPPEPDFLVESDLIVGIELTRIFKGGQEAKRRESEQDEIITKSKDLYSGRQQIPVAVHIHWNHYHQPAKNGRDLIAEQIAHIVEENVPQLGEEIELNGNYPPAILPEAVDTIVIDRRTEYNLNFWSSPRGSIVPELEPKDLQSVVDKKNVKYSHYSGRCHQLWLLVVAESIAPSGFCYIPSSTKSATYSSVFDRLLFFSFLPPQAIELQTTPIARFR